MDNKLKLAEPLGPNKDPGFTVSDLLSSHSFGESRILKPSNHDSSASELNKFLSAYNFK